MVSDQTVFVGRIVNPAHLLRSYGSGGAKRKGVTDLRNALVAALSSADPAASPRVVNRPDKTVFQYLGTIERPRQIALRTPDGSLVYDFRTGTASSVDGGPGVQSGSPDPSGQLTALVHLWERMIIARGSNER